MEFDRDAWSEALKGLVQRHFDAFVADVSPSLPEVRWHTEWPPGIYVPFAGGLLFDHDRGEAFRQSVMVGVSANDRGDRLEIFVDDKLHGISKRYSRDGAKGAYLCAEFRYESGKARRQTVYRPDGTIQAINAYNAAGQWTMRRFTYDPAGELTDEVLSDSKGKELKRLKHK